MLSGPDLCCVGDHRCCRQAQASWLPACDARNGGSRLSYRSIAAFYYPLALTTVLALGLQPIVTFFMGHAPSPLRSLAVLPVVSSLVFLFRALGLAYQEVCIALIGDDLEGYQPLRRFAIVLAAAVTAGLGLIAWTPLAQIWFQHV